MTRWWEKVRSAVPAALIVLFLGLLWAPTLDSVFHWDATASVDEKRALAAFPRFSLAQSSMRAFITQLEAYYNDHFGFRKRLIYWGHTWKRQWFHDAIQANVIIGRSGWLYYGASDIDLSRRNTLFTAQELEQWRTLLEARRDWLFQRGIGYLFVIAPRKQSIYPEYLPDWIRPPGAVTKLDQFVAYMRARSSVEVLDLRPALLRTKAIGRTFFCTDTHWNELGAFVASEELIRALRLHSPTLQALGLDAFEIKTTSAVGGNLAQMLVSKGMPGQAMGEKDCPELRPRPPRQRLEAFTEEKALAKISSVENPRQSGRTLIFGDSFMEPCLPFLGQHFQRAVVYRIYNRGNHLQADAHTWIPQAIQQEKPNTVIDEIAEVFLETEDPELLRREDLLRNDTQAK